MLDQRQKVSNQTSFLSNCPGAAAELFRSIDWGAHPLGPIENWPSALKTILNIVFHSKHPMFIWWGPDLYQFYNDAYIPSFGIGKHPLAMGQKGIECWPEIWPIIKPQIDTVMSGAGSTWNENQLVPIHRNGQIEDVYWTYGYSPIFNEDQTIGGTLVVCTETTQQVSQRNFLSELTKRSELERSKLQNLFLQAPVPLAMLEGPEHRFSFANEIYKRFFIKDLDFIGKPVAEVIPEAAAQGFINLLDHVYKTGERYIGNETFFHALGADGISRDFYLNFVYEAQRNSEGEIIGILAAISDVTEQVNSRKKVEEVMASIETERNKFATIFAEASMAMAITRGPEHTYEHANSSYLQLFEGRELVGKPLLTALPELRDQRFPELFEQVFHTGQAYIEREALAKLRRSVDGPLEERYFNQSYTRLLDGSGNPYGVFVHAIEITEMVLARRQLQESRTQLAFAKESAEQANAAKSAFLANMSHEIRTPLGAIMGFADLIKDENLNRATLEDYLTIIDRNSNQLLRIIDDILDLSKVEAGMMLIENIEFSFIELLTDFSSLMSFKAKDKGINFNLKASTELPNIISSDPTRLRQILTNVVGNAIKFTEHGHVDLIVSYDNGFIQFEVQDTGRGISKEQEAVLFQPFSQADASITRKFGGSGLGLALTRRLSLVLGGEFYLKDSILEEGSTFVAKVKVDVPKNVKMLNVLGYSPAIRIGKTNLGNLQGLSILVVDDSPDNQILLSILLRNSGALVDLASDGEEGMLTALSGNYDVVLMDVQMPVMDGITAVRHLRDRGYKKPVVALTAHAMKEERERCLQAGFSDFLSKPIQRESIFGLLKQIRDTLKR